MNKFTIDVEMADRWIPHFMSFLNEMERMGNTGESNLLAFYVDGDGDFRPKFNTDITYETKEKKRNGLNKIDFYDAG